MVSLALEADFADLVYQAIPEGCLQNQTTQLGYDVGSEGKVTFRTDAAVSVPLFCEFVATLRHAL